MPAWPKAYKAARARRSRRPNAAFVPLFLVNAVALPGVGFFMVTPVELSKLGAKARLKKLGYLKYIVICGLIFLSLAGMEILRYKNYGQCVNTETARLLDEAQNELTLMLVTITSSLSSLQQTNRISTEQLTLMMQLLSQQGKPATDKRGPEPNISKEQQHSEDITRQQEPQYLKILKAQQNIIKNTRIQDQEIIKKAQQKCLTGYRYDIFQWFSWINPIGTAHAQMKIGGYSENDIRGIVIVSIFACMGIFFFLSTGALFFSKNVKVVAFAMDTVKTLLGFFIGVAMSFMGVR